MDSKLNKTLEEIKELLNKNNLTLSSAESCTGGLISSYLTDISGASSYIFQNFVTYSNAAKMKFLNVQNSTLEKYGAVSNQTAQEMAKGLFNYAPTAIATTGILGPTGGSVEKPIGLCFIGLGYKKDDEEIIEVIKYISPLAKTDNLKTNNKETDNTEPNNRYEIKKDIAQQAIVQFLEFMKKHL